jgi:hypothetical protein
MASAVTPGLDEEIPEAARGLSFGHAHNIQTSFLSGTDPRFNPPTTKAVAPAQQQDMSLSFNSLADIYTPEALKAQEAWLKVEDRDIFARAQGLHQRSHGGLFLGRSARLPGAQDVVIDMRTPPPWRPVNVQAKLRPRLNAQLFAMLVGNAAYPDQALLSYLREGVTLFPESTSLPSLQTILQPVLSSITGLVGPLAASCADLAEDGDLLPSLRPAFSPAQLLPIGAATKGDPSPSGKVSVRRIADGGGPRKETLDSDGVPVVSINMLTDLHGKLADGSPKYPPEVKPSARDIKRDAAFLLYAAEILGVFAYSDDFRRFFHQFQVNARDEWRLNTLMLSASAVDLAERDDPLPPDIDAALLIYGNNALDMGLAVSSGIAQRFSTAVVRIVQHLGDSEEREIWDAAIRDPSTPPAHRKFYLIRRGMTARFNRNCERLTSAMIYTDDLAALACGIDRLVRFLILWTRVVDALKIRMAAAHKRVISQTARFIGFGLAVALGFAYIPAGKVTHGLALLDTILSAEPVPVSSFRSVTGLLIHFQSVLEAGPETLYAFHNTLLEAGTAPAALIVRTRALLTAAKQWINLLSTAAVGAFCPLTEQYVRYGAVLAPHFAHPKARQIRSYSTASETQRRGLTLLSGPEGTPRAESPATFSLIQAARAFLPPTEVSPALLANNPFPNLIIKHHCIT